MCSRSAKPSRGCGRALVQAEDAAPRQHLLRNPQEALLARPTPLHTRKEGYLEYYMGSCAHVINCA